MKVFALGGYGTQGLLTAGLLAKSDLVSEITLAGRSGESAKQAQKTIGDKARAVQVDGTDEKLLASLVAGHDIIVNTGRSRVALPALHAAIRTGAHYCDLGFGQDLATETQMLEFKAEARDADIIAIICNGNCPGITNLMGVHAADQLDETEQLQGGLSFVFGGPRVLTPQQWLENPKESFVLLQVFRWCLGWMLKFVERTESRLALAYRDGRWVDEDPLAGGLLAPLPQGGSVTAYPYCSCDPYSLWGGLPHDLSRAQPVQVWLSPFSPQLNDLYREQALRVAAGDIDPEFALDTFYDTVETDPNRWLTVTDDFVALPVEWVTAVGHKGRRAARYSCWLTPAMGIERNARLLAGASLAVSVLRILRGEIRERGVMTAEKCFGPLPYLNEVVSMMPDPPSDGKLIDESFEWLE
jgi:hypothetical protein